MKFIFIVLLFIVNSAFAAEVIRLKDESDSNFVERMTKEKINIGDDHKLQITKTKKLIKDKEVIVAFTEFISDDNDKNSYDLSVNIFTRLTENKFAWIKKTAVCEVESGSPKIRSYFFFNVDQQPDLEIGVICGWKENQSVDCQKNDEVRFFKTSLSSEKNELSQVEDKRFEILYKKKMSQSDKALQCRISNFKTASDVKRILQQKGFKQ